MTMEPMRGDAEHRGLGELLRENRVPLALISVGIAWLLADSTGLIDRLAKDPRVQTARRRISEVVENTRNGVGLAGSGSQILGPGGEPAIRTGEMARGDGWVHQAAGAARGAISSVRDAGDAVLDRAGRYADYAGDAGDLAKRAGEQLVGKLERDPWWIGVVGMVAGAVLAAVLPPTAIEQQRIGEARDGLMNKAADLGHEAADRVRELAESATRVGKS